jgi:hypothetical protein
MGLFWSSATAQAGREFGARHYRWFVGARIARVVLPPLFGLIAIVGFVVAAVAGWRWLSPRWVPATHGAAGWASGVLPAVLWIAGGLVALGAVVGIVVWVRRSWWRWSLSRPMWMRRY